MAISKDLIDSQNNEDFKVEEHHSWYHSSSDSKTYDLVRYTGNSQDVVIPEYIVGIKDSAFAGKNIQSLTLPRKISLIDLKTLKKIPSLKHLILTYTYDENIYFDILCNNFPALEILEFQNASRLYVHDPDMPVKAGQHIEVRIPSAKIESIAQGCRDYVPGFILFAPNITPGRIEAPLRLNAIDTFLSHPDWYTEESSASYKGWIQKNIDKLLPVCAEYKAEDLLLKCLPTEDLRLPAKAYDRIIQMADKSKNQELKASALLQKGKYYDLVKLAKRDETLAMNDMEDPLRNHAMKQFWSWGTLEDDSLVIKKYKAGKTGDAPAETDIEIPSIIAGKPVTTLSGSVFKDTTIRKVLIPDSIIELSGTVFALTSVEEIIFEGSIHGIPDRCFQTCRHLSSVHYPQNALLISSSEIEVPSSMPDYTQPFVIGRGAFEHSSIRYALIQNAVLCQKAFYNADLRSITLRNVPTIPEKCFSNCEYLTAIDLQGSAVIDSLAFEYCSSLTDIHVSDSIFSISQMAFDGCRNLRRIHMHGIGNPERIRNVFPRYIREKAEFIQED